MGEIDMAILTVDKLENFLNNYPGCLFLKDENGRYIYTSEICEHVDQWSTGGIIGKNELQAQKNKELGKQYYEQDMKLLKEGGSIKCYSEVSLADHIIYYEINKSAVCDKDGHIIGIIGTVVDVSKEIELQRQVQKQLITDPVTGLYNNVFLKQWREKEQIIYPFSIIACDCNFLKIINDTYGHESGDELLKRTAELFLENLPSNCYPVRTGGDEFIILCNDTSESKAEEYIKIMQSKAKNKSVCGRELSVALGSCTMDQDEMTFEECKNRADACMYVSKRKMKEAYFDQAGKQDPVYNDIMLRKLMDQMPVILFYKDTKCRYKYINYYDEKHLKNKEKTHFGIGCTDLELQKDPVLGRQYYEDDLRILQTGMGSILINAIPDEDRIRYYQITKSAVRDEKNNIIGIVGTVIDVTATKLSFENNQDSGMV